MPILSVLAAWTVLDKTPASVTAAEIDAAHAENKKLLDIKADVKVNKGVGRVRRSSKGNEEATKIRIIVVTIAAPNDCVLVEQNLMDAVMVLAQNAYRASF